MLACAVSEFTLVGSGSANSWLSCQTMVLKWCSEQQTAFPSGRSPVLAFVDLLSVACCPLVCACFMRLLRGSNRGTSWLGMVNLMRCQSAARFFPKAPAKGFSLSTAAYFIFLNLFLLLHLPHSLFLTLFLLLHLPHSLFLTLFILLHLPYFIFFTNFLLLHPHNIII